VLLTVIALSLAVYRITRFVIDDTLIEEPRDWLRKKLVEGKSTTVRTKILDLMECPYCVSVWVAAGAVLLASWTWTVPEPFWSWLAVCGGAMIVWRIVEVEE
jgi:hypothetical protein